MANELEVQQKAELALQQAKDLGFSSEDNFDGGETPELPQCKILSTAQMFEMPDGEKVEGFEGILLYKHTCNILFSGEEGDKTIFCQSPDAIKSSSGKDIQSEFCKDCPKNQYESAENGKGKACKNQIRTFWIIKGYQLPVVLMLPPTSIKSFAEYLTSLSSGVLIGKTRKALHYCQSIANLELEREESGGNVWSVLKAKFNRIVDNQNTLKRLKDLRSDFMSNFKEDVKESEVHIEVVEDSEPRETAAVLNRETTPVGRARQEEIDRSKKETAAQVVERVKQEELATLKEWKDSAEPEFKQHPKPKPAGKLEPQPQPELTVAEEGPLTDNGGSEPEKGVVKPKATTKPAVDPMDEDCPF